MQWNFPLQDVRREGNTAALREVTLAPTDALRVLIPLL